MIALEKDETSAFLTRSERFPALFGLFRAGMNASKAGGKIDTKTHALPSLS